VNPGGALKVMRSGVSVQTLVAPFTRIRLAILSAAGVPATVLNGQIKPATAAKCRRPQRFF